MSIPGAMIPVSRGTLTFPWGTNRMVVQVDSLAPDEEVALLTFMGPNKNGYDMTSTHRPNRTVVIRGKYTASDVVSQFGMSGLRGAADIQFGTGEHWTGNVMVLKCGGGFTYGSTSGDVEMTVKFYGAAPTTPNAAGTNGI